MADGKDNIKRYRLVFFALLAALFLFRLWFMTTLPLSGDESYHWEWSRNLAFGYYDHPGLTAYLIRLSTWLFGRSTEFTVRLPALLMLTGTAIICFLFARLIARTRGASEMNAERAGLLAGLLILITPVFAFLSIYISTDPPLIFSWTLMLYLLYRAFHTNSWPDWIGAGIAMGLAMMSKFLAFFIIPAVLIFIVVSPEDRKILAKPQVYVAGLCALLVISPFLVWNATHGWATFMFNFGYRQKAIGLAPWHTLEFIFVQAGVLTPGIFVFAVFILGRMVREWVKTKQRDSLFLAATSLVPLLYFLYVSFREQVGPHWPATAWIGAIAYLAYYWEASGATAQNTVVKQLKRISLGLCILMTVIVHLLPHTPYEWVKPRDWRYPGDPSRISTKELSELFGWRELGEWVSKARNDMTAAQKGNGKGVFVISSSYALASSVAFYTPDQIRTHLWSRRKTHGENYRFWDDFHSLKDMDAVFVVKKEKYARNAIPKLREHFSKVETPERLPVMVGGEEVRSFFLVRCYEFNGIAPDFTK